MGPDSIFKQIPRVNLIQTIYRLISENYILQAVIPVFKYILNFNRKAWSCIPYPTPSYYDGHLISHFPETINFMKVGPMFDFTHHGVPTAYHRAQINICWMNNNKEKKKETLTWSATSKLIPHNDLRKFPISCQKLI